MLRPENGTTMRTNLVRIAAWAEATPQAADGRRMPNKSWRMRVIDVPSVYFLRLSGHSNSTTITPGPHGRSVLCDMKAGPNIHTGHPAILGFLLPAGHLTNEPAESGTRMIMRTNKPAPSPCRLSAAGLAGRNVELDVSLHRPRAACAPRCSSSPILATGRPARCAGGDGLTLARKIDGAEMPADSYIAPPTA